MPDTVLPASAAFAVRDVDDGCRRISRHPRAVQEVREPARLITMAWGERYISDLLEVTIPALLAPGNVPAFSRQFDCEFVIVTETRLFDMISGHPAIAELARYGDVRLVPIDDLLSPWYGISLTYALVRGFADLGPAMVDTHLMFLNADFIVADGSYARLAECIKRGERLIVSPSYCMVLEDTIDVLRSRRDPASGALVWPKRELARLIIAHRHNTIRAKTVNQRLFRIHRYDQFYWHVDEQTLLGRQMPIAVVYMRPERVLTEMPTFWDYGVIREYCPSLTPCVLGDSDDFLMAELRSEGTARELLQLGWPKIEEIAADLSSFTTQDHRDYGRHTLVLHGGDLPPDTEIGRAELNRFADQVYDRLRPPINHREHPFWAPVFPRFLEMHRAALAARREREAALQRLLREDGEAAARQARIDTLRGRLLALRACEGFNADNGEPPAGEAVQELEGALASLCRVQDAVLGGSNAGAIAGTPDAVRASGSSAERRREARLATLGRIYGRIFGRLPRTTAWHPYHMLLAPVMRAIGDGATLAEALVISSGGPFGNLIAKALPGHKISTTPRMLGTEFYSRELAARGGFDLCLCDLAEEDLRTFRTLLTSIRPFMRERARVVVFHQNPPYKRLDGAAFEFARELFPLVGRSRIDFSGSRLGAIAARWYERALARHQPARLASNIRLALNLLACAPCARIASSIEARRVPQRLPRRCTSITITIDLP